jgi:hypothetical protein
VRPPLDGHAWACDFPSRWAVRWGVSEECAKVALELVRPDGLTFRGMADLYYLRRDALDDVARKAKALDARVRLGEDLFGEEVP